jgi:hypothetical protein
LNLYNLLSFIFLKFLFNLFILDNPQTSPDQSSKLIFISGANAIIDFDQKTNNSVYKAHTKVVGNGLPKEFLDKWVRQENEKMQKFLICYFDKSSNEITKMLSGEQYQESETSKIYTILNSYAKDKRNGNATQLIFDLVEHIQKEDSETIKKLSSSLDLKLSQDCDLVKIESTEEKKKALNDLNIIALSQNGLKFAETDDKTKQKHMAEIEGAQLWGNENFKFFSSFLDAPELQPQLEVGSTTGYINLIATIPITKNLLKYIENKKIEIMSKNSGIEITSSQRLQTETLQR